jgi:hypothetical protein
MVVYPGPVFYQYIDKARLPRIAREHLGNGVPVAEYLWVDPARRPWRDRHPTAKPGTIPSPPGKRNDPGPRKEKPRKTYEVDDFKW